MVKGKELIVQTPESSNQQTNDKPKEDNLDFLFEEELNDRIVNRKRRNALTCKMVQDIKDMIKNGEFNFED